MITTNATNHSSIRCRSARWVTVLGVGVRGSGMSVEPPWRAAFDALESGL